MRSPRILFRNQGDGTFVEMGAEAGPGIVARHCSRGPAFGDFDNDGDMDVLIMNVNEPPSLLRNDAPPGNHWIKIRLEGIKSNRSAIGARVLARYGGKVQVQEVLEPIQLSLRQRSPPALRPWRCDNRRHRDPLAPRACREVSRTCRRSALHHSGRRRHCKGTPISPFVNLPLCRSSIPGRIQIKQKMPGPLELRLGKTPIDG